MHMSKFEFNEKMIISMIIERNLYNIYYQLLLESNIVNVYTLIYLSFLKIFSSFIFKFNISSHQSIINFFGCSHEKPSRPKCPYVLVC